MTRVTGMDVMLLYGETPSWHMHVSGLVLLDPSTAPAGFDAESVRKLYAERLACAPQFRWKLRDVAAGLDSPVFVEDEHFDPVRHFHEVAVPAPGGARELGELVGALMMHKLDRSRPLWEVWLIDGLAGGQFAMFTKIHHSIIDGVSGADLAGILMDLGPVPMPREPLPVVADPAPSTLGGVAGALAHAALSPLRTARYTVQLGQQAAVVARHLRRGTRAGLPFATARSRLNGALTPRRSMAFASVPFADVTRVKAAFGVKVNDVLLAMIAGAVRTWLDGRGELPGRSLVAEMPVTMRHPGDREVGTRVANTFVSLATDIEDPVERLLTIHRSSGDAKALQRDLVARKHVNLSDVPPPVLLGAAVRAFGRSGLESRIPPIYSLIVSSVPGPSFDLYLAGAKVTAIYPMGPLLYASGLNATVLTMADRVHVGLLSCPDVVADPWAVADGVPGALAELVARCPRRRRPRATSAR